MKTYYQSRNPRERLLLTVFAAVVCGVLGWHALGRERTLQARWQEARADQAAQRAWLANASSINARAAAAAKHLDPTQTLNTTRLVGELNAMVGRAGLVAEINSQASEHSEQFAFHTVRVDFRRAQLGPLLRFYEELSARAPYIALERFSLTTERSDPGVLNVSFQVVAAGLEH